MIVEPENRVADFAKAGADIISVHVESKATTHLDRVIQQVKLWLQTIEQSAPILVKQFCVSESFAHAGERSLFACLMVALDGKWFWCESRSKIWAARLEWY